jgi:hypothetical protein
MATDYGLDSRGAGVRDPVGSRFFSSPCRSDRFWGPPSPLSNRYRGLFPREQRCRRVQFTIRLSLSGFSDASTRWPYPPPTVLSTRFRKTEAKFLLSCTLSLSRVKVRVKWSLFLIKRHAMKKYGRRTA